MYPDGYNLNPAGNSSYLQGGNALFNAYGGQYVGGIDQNLSNLANNG